MRGTALRLILVCLGIIVAATPAQGAVRLPAIFGDHMVLQQQTEAAIWGWATPDTTVTIRPSWEGAQAVEVKAGADGSWRTRVATPAAGGPYTIELTEGETLTLEDVLIGEVWLCSGQSNMQWAVSQAAGAQEAIANGDLPKIRLFYVKRETAREPQNDCKGSWQVCSSETVADFSAVGYFFGRKLHQELGGPVGLICSAWGGTPAEAWTSGETLSGLPGYEKIVQLIRDPKLIREELAWQEYRQELFAWEKNLLGTDPGTQQRWHQGEVDTSDWQSMEMPRLWQGTELEAVDGIVWFRRVTNLPPSWARRDLILELGPIDDIDTVWMNGVYLGTTWGWDQPRQYTVPAAALKVGPNVITVRVIDTGGEGGFGGEAGDMRLGLGGDNDDNWATVARQWKYKLSYTGQAPPPPQEPGLAINQRSPSVLYNAMIAPLAGYALAGATWYQGESNAERPLEYRELFPAMIRDWRAKWGGDFPFYYVQIAPYDYDSDKGSGHPRKSQYLREAQLLTLSKVENTGMAVTMDVAEEKDIHPRDKVTVGERLARWALAKTYGREGLVYSGPLYRDMQIEGEAIRVFFDHVNGGLKTSSGELTCFEIAGEAQDFVPAQARIDGETVIVHSEAVKEPRAVRYAWANWAQPSLFNEAGLPASSFRTDDWATIEDGPQPWADLLD